MGKTPFRFESILKVRENRRDQIAQELQALLTQKEELTKRLEEATDANIQHEKQWEQEVQKDSPRPAILPSFMEHHRVLNSRCEAIKTQLEQLQSAIESKRRELTESVSDVKLMEKIRENDQEKQQQSEQKAEEKMMDESLTPATVNANNC